MSDDSDVSFEALSEDDENENHSLHNELVLAPARAARPSDHTDNSYDDEFAQPSTQAHLAANSWQDVDREQLSTTVLKLISSVASTAPTDDKSRDAVWHPTTTLTVTQNLNDPLGFGKIDIASMRLMRERDGAAEQQQQQWQGPARSPGNAAMAAATAGQNKGAVGRFFSELTKQGSTGAAGTSPGAQSRLGKKAAASASSTAAGRDGAAQGAAGFSGGRPKPLPAIPPSKLLPSEEGFDPEAYLAVFHEGSSMDDLRAGLRALDRELGERTGQLKQLVKQNFERFISCKTTIDDIYVKLQHIESTSTGISTEILYNAIQEGQDGASRVFGPILERSAKAERIRSVQLLLRRFQGLFSAPQRIRALAAAGDYEQVTSEFKKANGLIKPGPKTIKVWASLYAEIEKRVAEVYMQLQSEIQDPQLPAATASELVVHMLQLQAEGLAAAQGQDPLALLLAARETQFAGAMQAVSSEHERAVARLRATMAAAATDEKLQDPAAISESQLLRWRGSWETATTAATSASSAAAAARTGAASASNSPTAAAAAAASASSTVFARTLTGYRGSAAAAAAAAAAAGIPDPAGVMCASDSISDYRPGFSSAAHGVLGLAGSRHHLADVAPLSGLQPPAPRSRLVQDMRCTPAEGLYLRHLQRQSEVLLECLPGLWQAAGTNKLQLPVNLPASAATKLQATLAGAADILQRLVGSYCSAVGGLVTALAGVGSLREALLVAAEELAVTLRELEVQKAPPAALAAVRAVLGSCVAAGVQQLVGHLHAVPGWLIAKERWQLSVTHSGSQPITLMPEQLQEEVTVAMQYYQQLLASSTGSSTGNPSTSTAAKIIAPDKSTKPIRDAYFTCLEDTVKTCKAAADQLRPSAAAAAAAAAAGSGSSTRDLSPLKRSGMSAAAAAAVLGQDLLFDNYDAETEGTLGVGAASSTAAAAGGAAGAAGVLRLQLSDDVRLLLMGSNLTFMRERLVGSLTQRFLLVLTGEVASELDRCSRYVVKLAGRLDAAIQGVHAVYLERKQRSIDRLLANYIRADGVPVGSPPDLRDVSPHAQQLVQLAAAVQSETYTYARPFMQQLLHAALEHLGSAMSTAFASLPSAAAPGAAAGTTAAAAVAAGCPVEALGQYFMDLVYLEAILSKAGPASLSVDLTAAYQLLASRMCPGADGRLAAGRQAAETPLARSLLAIKDPQELSRKLQVTCRKALRDVLERSSFTVRSLLAATAAGSS